MGASGFERCSGIPATLKTEFQTESAQCARETVIPTPVSILAERISTLNRPVGMTHVVEKQSTKLCISKQMVKTCLSKPLSIKQKSVEFSASPTHPCSLAPLRSAPLLVSPSSRRSVSSQLSSARLSLSQSPASLRCPPSPSKQYN